MPKTGVIIQNLSIPKRFNRLLLILSLPGLIAILFLLIDERSDILSQSEQQTHALVQQVVRLQQNEIVTTHKLLNQLAQHEELLHPEQGKCSKLLRYAGLISQGIANMGVVDLNGDVLCTLQDLPSPINISDRPYFQHTLMSQQFSVGQFQVDRSIHQPTVNFAIPVFDHSQTLSHVLVVSKLLEVWSNSLAKLPLPTGSQVFISDANHHVVANYPYNKALLGTDVSAVWPNIQSGRIQQLTDTFGMRRLYLQQSLDEPKHPSGLMVHIAIPFETQILQANQKIAFILSIMLIVVLVLFWQAKWQLNRVLLQPLKALQSALDAFAQGNKTLWKSAQLTPEFNAIAERFEHMANKRLASEQALAHKHAELNGLLYALPDHYLRINKRGDILMSHGEFEKPYRHISEFLPETTAPMLLQQLTQIKEDEHFQFEFTKLIQGEQKTYECHLTPIREHQQIILVLRDATHRKAQEEAMTLAALVYQTSSEGMVITDAKDTILDVNPAFSQVTGYQKPDVIGKRISLLSSGKHPKSFYQKMWRQIQETGNWQGEIVNRRQNGELFTEWLTINTVYDKSNEPYQRVAIFTDITEKKRQDELIWRRTHFDQLTELANRQELKRHLQQLLVEDLNISILLLDLDHFKDINDSLGHYYGDRLLSEVAMRLNKLAGQCSLISRIGGDEFVLVLRESLDDTALIQVAEQVLDSLQQVIQIDNELCHISASIGIAKAPQDGKNSGQLLKAADQAMYLAKQQGRNGYAFFDQKMREHAEQRMQLLKDLRIAIREQQFALYYQPIVDMQTQQVVKAEALIRWIHPEKGVISPARFIPLAEESQLILMLGDFIFDSACSTLEALNEIGSNLQLSVNVSPVQFAAKHSSLLQWQSKMQEKGLSTENIVIEITEGLMMNAQHRTQYRLSSLTQQGFALALDDFGTGYSSLAYLKQMETDFIKIDKRFVDGIAENADDRALCEAMIMMAHQLGLKVIAEGIETQAQHEQLLAAGCDYGQGYYYAKPMPETQLLSMLSEQ